MKRKGKRKNQMRGRKGRMKRVANESKLKRTLAYRGIDLIKKLENFPAKHYSLNLKKHPVMEASGFQRKRIANRFLFRDR